MDKLEAATQAQEAQLQRALAVVRRPGEHGWEASVVSGAVLVPLTAVTLTLMDAMYVLLRRGGARGDGSALSPSNPAEADHDSTT